MVINFFAACVCVWMCVCVLVCARVCVRECLCECVCDVSEYMMSFTFFCARSRAQCIHVCTPLLFFCALARAVVCVITFLFTHDACLCVLVCVCVCVRSLISCNLFEMCMYVCMCVCVRAYVHLCVLCVREYVNTYVSVCVRSE